RGDVVRTLLDASRVPECVLSDESRPLRVRSPAPRPAQPPLGGTPRTSRDAPFPPSQLPPERFASSAILEGSLRPLPALRRATLRRPPGGRRRARGSRRTRGDGHRPRRRRRGPLQGSDRASGNSSSWTQQIPVRQISLHLLHG